MSGIALDSYAARLALLPAALKSLREKTGMTQSQVAAMAHERSDVSIKAEQIDFWESGKIHPSMPSLFAFLDALGADLRDLAGAMIGPGTMNMEELPETESYQLAVHVERVLSKLSRQITAMEERLNQLHNPPLQEESQ